MHTQISILTEPELNLICAAAAALWWHRAGGYAEHHLLRTSSLRANWILTAPAWCRGMAQTLPKNLSCSIIMPVINSSPTCCSIGINLYRSPSFFFLLQTSLKSASHKAATMPCSVASESSAYESSEEMVSFSISVLVNPVPISESSKSKTYPHYLEIVSG